MKGGGVRSIVRNLEGKKKNSKRAIQQNPAMRNVVNYPALHRKRVHRNKKTQKLKPAKVLKKSYTFEVPVKRVRSGKKASIARKPQKKSSYKKKTIQSRIKQLQNAIRNNSAKRQLSNNAKRLNKKKNRQDYMIYSKKQKKYVNVNTRVSHL